MKYYLKISDLFWAEISNRQKIYEFRKMSKNFINKGDFIYFVSTKNNRVFGCCVVVNKKTVPYKKIINHSEIDEKSYNFIKQNYNNEYNILVFEIKLQEVFDNV